ncbi:tRNA (N6-isopentenyl adenosine(37)-C2)-methylthiotransferase MiaB [Deltaproteobacteria bacterium TL4]
MPLSQTSQTAPKKVYIQTFGCQMNEHDTQKMFEVLRRENFASTPHSEEADLILVNTCSVRDKAEQKVYSLLGRLRKLKKKNPALVIGVGGCVAQQEGIKLLRRSPDVDLVFGTDNLFDLPQMLESVRRGERVVQTERKRHQHQAQNFIPDFSFEQVKPAGIKAHISITKGCNNFCTFCIVPVTRGLEVSREPQHIHKEVEHLVAEGIQEICLLGQNVNSYQSQGVDFVELLSRLDTIEGLKRLRFISPHPKDFDESLAKAIQKLPSVCEHMHLPLQAGSNQVLRQMRRRYTLEEYLGKVDLLKKYVPNAAISTDLIVGFPGESDEDFSETMRAVETVEFDQIYAFKYSPRPGTPASKLENQVPEPVKADRLSLVLEAYERLIAQKFQRMVGSVQEVLVEGAHPRVPECSTGRSRGNHSVAIQKAQLPVGTLAEVTIVGRRQYSLIADLLQK